MALIRDENPSRERKYWLAFRAAANDRDQHARQYSIASLRDGERAG
ncbi:hypothetical protein [Paraburkholderia sediminicola]